MAKAKHTPGPWTVGERMSVWSEHSGQLAAVVCASVDRPTSEERANARLIAAAPDMLAALRSISRKARALADDRDTHNRGFWVACADEADGALAKAEGRS